MTTRSIKTIAISLAVLGVLGLLVLYVLWRTSPVQMGKEAFAATELPVRTLAQAKAMAKAEGKPLLIDIAAYWCPMCRRFDREVLSNSTVKETIQNQYVFVRVDSEAEGTRSLMKGYGVYAYPSLLITDADGVLIRRLPTTFDAEEFLQALTQ